MGGGGGLCTLKRNESGGLPHNGCGEECAGVHGWSGLNAKRRAQAWSYWQPSWSTLISSLRQHHGGSGVMHRRPLKRARRTTTRHPPSPCPRAGVPGVHAHLLQLGHHLGQRLRVLSLPAEQPQTRDARLSRRNKEVQATGVGRQASEPLSPDARAMKHPRPQPPAPCKQAHNGAGASGAAGAGGRPRAHDGPLVALRRLATSGNDPGAQRSSSRTRWLVSGGQRAAWHRRLPRPF